MRTLQEFLNEQLQDPEFQKEYEKFQPEMDAIRTIADVNNSQNLTQKNILNYLRIGKNRTLRDGGSFPFPY